VSKATGCAVTFLVFIAIIIIISLATMGGDNSKPTETDAYYFAREFVKNHLKVPSTARFPSIRDDNVFISRFADTWTVTGYVDAENSFGAAIRNYYECQLQYDEDEKAWYLKDLEFY
jgi:hypothetical protein